MNSIGDLGARMISGGLRINNTLIELNLSREEKIKVKREKEEK